MTIKTAREFYTAVIALTGIDPAITEYAKTAIVKLDEKGEKRKESPSAIKRRTESDAFRSTVFTALSTVPQTAAEIAAVIGCESVPKVTAALTALVKSSEVVKGERKVSACKAKGIKGGKFSVYSVPTSGEDETEPGTDADESEAMNILNKMISAYTGE